MNIGKQTLTRDFFTFVKAKKKLWVVLLVFMLTILAILIIIGAGNLFAPSSYTSF
ncbi:MAG: hypothetical protein HQK49_08895 [Oligoflexia bacterium]|nr:hypothetical protein [Oligoflexia bacterium]